MKKTRVLALAGAIAGIMATMPAAHAHHSYNLDGYTNTSTGHSLSGNDGGNPSVTPAILGTTARWTAGGPGAGYTGALPGMWYAAFHGLESHNLSTGDALAKTWNHDGDTGPSATPLVPFATTHAGFELAVGPKSWEDTAVQGANTGWGHGLDFGLIKLDVAGHLNITVEADGSGLLPAFSLYQGWDTGTGVRHGPYVNNVSNPLSGTGLILLGSIANDGDGSVTYQFNNLAAGGKYSLFIGGDDGAVGGKYKVNMTLSQVPLPAAVWLFGSALAGMGVIGRRRRSVA